MARTSGKCRSVTQAWATDRTRTRQITYRCPRSVLRGTALVLHVPLPPRLTAPLPELHSPPLSRAEVARHGLIGKGANFAARSNPVERNRATPRDLPEEQQLPYRNKITRAVQQDPHREERTAQRQEQQNSASKLRQTGRDIWRAWLTCCWGRRRAIGRRSRVRRPIRQGPS